MRYSRGKRKNLMAEINVVPYIDVMLVLLVIFMITAPLLSQGVKIKLPQANAKPLSVKQSQPIILSVTTKGMYYLNVASNPTQAISPQALVTRVAAELQLAKEEGKHRAVLVKGDRDVDYGKIMQAMVLLQHAGASNIGLMTKPIENKRLT